MRLNSFASGARAAVFGAGGAIGGAILARLAAEPTFEIAYAGARRPLKTLPPKTVPFYFDLRDEDSIAGAAKTIGANGGLDLVIVATGVLHSGDELVPEKTWRDFKPDAFTTAFAINATGPALIAKHMLPWLAKDRRSVFAVLSARVGSIEDNRLGGWAAYRASKAALHQIVRTCAIELARKNPSACCIALHPGTVDSPLSRPFQRHVAAASLSTPDQGAAHLLRVIDTLRPDDSGKVFAWDGARIPF